MYWFSEVINGVYHFYLTIGETRYAENTALRSIRSGIYHYKQRNDPRAISTLVSFEYHGMWYEHLTAMDYDNALVVMLSISTCEHYRFRVISAIKGG